MARGIKVGRDGLLLLEPLTLDTATATVKGAARMLKQNDMNSFIRLLRIFDVKSQKGSVKNGSSISMSNLFFDWVIVSDSDCKLLINVEIGKKCIYLQSSPERETGDTNEESVDESCGD